MKKILIAAVMFLALSAAAFAQTSFTVSSVPESYVACCGLTERTGDIAFTAISGTPNSIAGTLTVTYPTPVTNSSLTGIGVTSVAGVVGTLTGVAPAVAISSAQNVDGKGVVVITVAAGGIYPFSITLSGVRVNVSGACSGSVSATITSTGNLLTSGETSVVVISNVAQALRTPALATLTTAVSINAVTGGQTGGVNIDTGTSNGVNLQVKENFLDAFGKINGAAGDPSANISKMIRLTVSKVPAGVTLTFPVADSSGLFTLAASNGTLATAAASLGTLTTPGAVYYRLTTNSNPTVLESLIVLLKIANTGPYPLTSGSVTVTAHIAPFDASIVPTLIPRYTDDAACETGSVTVLNIVGASTTLLVPYAVNSAGYDTGIEVANTTTDPGTLAMGFTQAVRQSGTMTFYFYPQTGDAFSYATVAGSPGAGLSADGALATGRIYTVMLSQLLTAAQKSGFSGYIIIITNFTNAHGQYFISDFEYFTNGALMLVVNNPSAGRANPEILGN